jgi:pimeloyl-ACP methyl ester carboxylesterase
VLCKTDATEDLKRMGMPSLFLHADNDQIVPIDAVSELAVKIVKDRRSLFAQAAQDAAFSLQPSLPSIARCDGADVRRSTLP